MFGKDIPAFVSMIGWEGPASKSMVDVFMELDAIYSKMEAQKVKRDAQKRKDK